MAVKNKNYTIEKRRDKRFAVKKRGGKYIHGEEKAKILLSEGLIAKPSPKANKEA